MESLKLKTTSGVDREINLVDYGIFRRGQDQVYDAVHRGVTGVETEYARARRRTFQIDVDRMPDADFQTLRKMKGDRQKVYLEGNLGPDTVLACPLQRGYKPITGNLGSFGRASVASYQGADGKIYPVGSGVARYEAAKIGTGILVENARTNYMYPSHPDATPTVIFSVLGGSPTIQWDGNAASNIDGHYGAGLIHGDSGEVVGISGIPFVDATPGSFYVWVKGMGNISVVGSTGWVSAPTSGAVALTGDWQRIGFEGGVSTAVNVSVIIVLNETDTHFHYSGIQLEDGYTFTSYIETTVAPVSRVMDQLYYNVAVNYIQGSIAFWTRWPRLHASGSTRNFFHIDSNFYALITAAGYLLFRYNTASSIGDTPAFAAGDMVHLAFVWRDDYAAIIVNGVELDADTGAAANQNRILGSASNIPLYYPSQNANTVIEDFRYDNHYVEWRISEGGAFLPYTDSRNLELRRDTQARLLTIRGGEFEPNDADCGYWSGSFSLEETDSFVNHTTEGA